MTDRIVIQPRAERDTREAAGWVLRESRSATRALRWAERVRAEIDSLRVHPERCPVDPDTGVHGEEVRVLLHGRRRGVYRILFVIQGDAVQSLTVRHAARRSLGEERDDAD